MSDKNEDLSIAQSSFVFKTVVPPCVMVALSFITSSCIEPYQSGIDDQSGIMSIEGSLIKGDSIQRVTLSRTTSLLNSQITPVQGCEVRVVDELGNDFTFIDQDFGNYAVAIADHDLVFDREYKLVVTTPEGAVYESAFEALNYSPTVDTVYYEIEDQMRTYTEDDYLGLQFYIDIIAPDSVSRYFRWKLTETYEYTSTGHLSYILKVVDGEVVQENMDDIWEFYRCWVSEKVPGTYLASTENLTVNEKKKIPLNYVSNFSDRLKIEYSLLVDQYSLTEGAFKYWDQNQVAIEESNGLYNTQPAQPVTNFRCTSNSEERVLGYFWVSSRTEFRIFVPRISSLIVYDFDCPTYEYNPDLHKKMPRYIRVEEETGILTTGHPACFDCRMRGGSTTKPDFWK